VASENSGPDPGPTTPLAELHEAAGAKFTAFAGWQMPVQFDSILTEHGAVRERVGVFDVSHMSNLEVPTTRADELASALGADVSQLSGGQAKYTLALDEDGTILDDLIVFRRADAFHVVPNAGQNEAIAEHFEDHGCGVADLTGDRCILAVQGPAVDDVLARIDVQRPGKFELAELPEAEGFVAGTGYTGEPGVEFVLTPEHAKSLWQDTVDAGAQPCGLGARDTLRLEKGYPLAGNEFDPPVTPVEADMLWALDLEHDFTGRDAVVTRREAGPERKLAGVELAEKGVPRRDCEIYHDDERIGRVSSGTMSPSLDHGIALAYLDPDAIEPMLEVGVEVRDRRLSARLAEVPFL